MCFEVRYSFSWKVDVCFYFAKINVAVRLHTGFMPVLVLHSASLIIPFAFSQYQHELPLVNVLTHTRFQLPMAKINAGFSHAGFMGPVSCWFHAGFMGPVSCRFHGSGFMPVSCMCR